MKRFFSMCFGILVIMTMVSCGSGKEYVYPLEDTAHEGTWLI